MCVSREQENRVGNLETKVQELEAELSSLQAVLNASLKLTEQFDILQKRVVLLEEIFLRLSETDLGKSSLFTEIQTPLADQSSHGHAPSSMTSQPAATQKQPPAS
nr:hypothetical protein BaRGS_011290 [Batillaria attramentaria]